LATYLLDLCGLSLQGLRKSLNLLLLLFDGIFCLALAAVDFTRDE
jgi:hypothetical protein